MQGSFVCQCQSLVSKWLSSLSFKPASGEFLHGDSIICQLRGIASGSPCAMKADFNLYLLNNFKKLEENLASVPSDYKPGLCAIRLWNLFSLFD